MLKAVQKWEKENEFEEEREAGITGKIVESKVARACFQGGCQKDITNIITGKMTSRKKCKKLIYSKSFM
ncbi:hypothetical protein GWI33_003934 [Rhynchophorus ferrugineus]|uniref:Uncharacterized protein n=1 Tax=Rhynchophorus ferrugineus TaxID=354439 RepID=A0A834LWV3_RHYFE|nr:hypothetical protein GWI33_003934 [Rhynchophorus ferrugineus]